MIKYKLRIVCIVSMFLFTNATYPVKQYNNQNKKLNIVFIGDSITEGGGLEKPPPATASEFLTNEKAIDIHFSNQGHSGFTTLDFLPGSGDTFTAIQKAADSLRKLNDGILLFSIMIGTNDSAEEGPNGSPVSPATYRQNLQTIIDSLLSDFPGSKIIIHHPTWYSPTTYNSSRYLAAGLKRLQSYFPEIDILVTDYKTSHPGQVFTGDRDAFGFFKKNHATHFVTEHGQRGVFYLHPNNKGAKALGEFWGKAIWRTLYASNKQR